MGWVSVHNPEFVSPPPPKQSTHRDRRHPRQSVLKFWCYCLRTARVARVVFSGQRLSPDLLRSASPPQVRPDPGISPASDETRAVTRHRHRLQLQPRAGACGRVTTAPATVCPRVFSDRRRRSFPTPASQFPVTSGLIQFEG